MSAVDQVACFKSRGIKKDEQVTVWSSRDGLSKERQRGSQVHRRLQSSLKSGERKLSSPPPPGAQRGAAAAVSQDPAWEVASS